MLKMIGHYIKESWLLVVSAFVFGLLIAVTNAAWQPKIIQNKITKLDSLMNVLIADAKFELILSDVPVETGRGKIAKSNIYKATASDGNCVGFCFGAEGSGFADKIELVVAVDAEFKTIMGYSVLSSNETPGFGDRITQDYFRNQFIGAPAAILNLTKKGDDKKIDDEIVAISGATVSSTAVVDIFNNYLKQIREKLAGEGKLADGK
ncbi:MAG: FMN-binding protein [Planctomycetes bacterium]|nr:FMN-binding protein [Planctomycetota bacterium]MBU1518730.1 FMN-binding protein [Planctomycetota bacterium]MBU2457617.1 FMN-binding protein [Planctomycetota bacterium]MBU2596783.1 FMN-binding protein [Planctomycetota bacterium]